jgi:hypothetical protein
VNRDELSQLERGKRGRTFNIDARPGKSKAAAERSAQRFIAAFGSSFATLGAGSDQRIHH